MDEQLLAYFWGEDWKGEYPQWERYTDEQKADFTRLKALLATEYDRGKVETIELALALIGEDEPTRLERDVTYTAHQGMDIFLAAARNELRQKLRQSLKEMK